MRTVFITGASGLVGGRLTSKYQSKNINVICLIHKESLDKRFEGLPNLRIVLGDITRRDLGLNSVDREIIQREVTDMWHCAAKTDFSISAQEGEEVNVNGTTNFLDFASQCKQVHRIGVLSTLYISGKTTGTVEEQMIEHSEGFVNEYERSKYLMELVVKERMQSLPIALYRISTAIGDAKTGEIVRYNAVHQAIRLLYGGLVPMIPAHEHTRMNFISDDHASDSLHYLFEERFIAGKVHHIAAKGDDMPNVAEFLGNTFLLFAQFHPEWQRRNIEIPPIVSVDSFALFKRTVEKTENSMLMRIFDMMDHFVPQLSYPKTFDMSGTAPLLEQGGIYATPFNTYYPMIVRQCLKSKKK